MKRIPQILTALTLTALLAAGPAWAQLDTAPSPADGAEPAAEPTLDDVLHDLSDEEADAFLAKAAKARLNMERQQAAAEIRQDVLYLAAGDKLQKAVDLLTGPSAETQADNIDRICRAFATVDSAFAKPYKLFQEEKYP
ncbi:MAG: hypothetical protein ACOC93_03870, partial [Planctomycetota bacterium]